MKTLELKLKKDVLIVDAEGLEITQALIFNKFGNYNLSYYEFLCKGSELTEEIASELVDKTIMHLTYGDNKHKYRSYVNYNLGFNNAKESFISAVESKAKFWLENPIEIIERGADTEHNRVLNQNEWQEAEEKTFKNPLIFVKKENLK